MAQWINLFQNNGFILQTSIIFFVRKVGPIHVAEPGLTAARQVVGRRNTGEFLEIFKNQCTSKDLTSCFL